MEKESVRKTGARDSFYGKIQSIQRGDIQALVDLATMGGHGIKAVITNDSLQRLALKTGVLIIAKVKAPRVILHKSVDSRECGADNVLRGAVKRIRGGEINTECTVRISDGTEVCSVVTSESCRRLDLAAGDEVRVVFNSFSVVLLSE